MQSKADLFRRTAINGLQLLSKSERDCPFHASCTHTPEPLLHNSTRRGDTIYPWCDDWLHVKLQFRKKLNRLLATAKAKAQAARTRAKGKFRSWIRSIETDAAIVEAATVQAELENHQSLGEPRSEENQRKFAAQDTLSRQPVKLESNTATPNKQSFCVTHNCTGRQCCLLRRTAHHKPAEKQDREHKTMFSPVPIHMPVHCLTTHPTNATTILQL